jgi:hypothetical protein
MDEILNGDPAVQPVCIASSLDCANVTRSASPKKVGPSSPKKAGPSSPKKRKVDKEPSWVRSYRNELREMHEERMELDKERMKLEERRVQALEQLANLLRK